MAKKFKTVKIQIDEKTEKGFTVQELSVQDIIDLSQNNPFFGASLNDENKTTENPAVNDSENGFMTELSGFGDSAREIMVKSCDFTIDDLKKLAPSDIDLIFAEWKEVNSSFLAWLDKVGILSAAGEILQKALSDFSRTLAI